MTTQTQIARSALTVSQRLTAGISAIVMGGILIFGVGLAHADGLHNAAHDTRHAIGFPCH